MGGRLHRQGPPPLGCVHGLDMNWASVFFTSSKMRCLHSWHSGRRQADPVRCSWFYVNALSRPLKLNSSLARDRAGIGGGRRNADEPLWIRLCVDRLRYLIPASADEFDFGSHDSRVDPCGYRREQPIWDDGEIGPRTLDSLQCPAKRAGNVWAEAGGARYRSAAEGCQPRSSIRSRTAWAPHRPSHGSAGARSWVRASARTRS